MILPSHSPEQVRILEALGRMPYGTLVDHEQPSEGPTMASVAAYLEELADVLASIAAEATQKARRLYDLEVAIKQTKWLLAGAPSEQYGPAADLVVPA